MALSQEEIRKLADLRKAIQFPGTPENGYADSGLWLFLDHVYTKDSHDRTRAVKKLPVADKDYLKVVFLYMLACDRLLLPKSRQIMMSWAMSAFSVWHAMSGQYKHVVYQTKKEDDAHAMVSRGKKQPRDGRMDFIIHHLPDWLKDQNIASGKGNNVGDLMFSTEAYDADGVPVPWFGSRIEAVPGGADQIASKTPSLAEIDEAAYHDSFGQVVVRALPALSGGGIFHAASSVDRGTDFNIMVLDTLDGDSPRHTPNEIVEIGMDRIGVKRPRGYLPKGMKSWVTRSGFTVLEVHYCADPEKDPERDGKKWFAEAVAGYPGGVKGDGWQTEMEINYGAGGGDKVFPFLSQVMSPVFIPEKAPKTVLATMNVFAGYDYGTQNPSAFVVWGMDENGQLFALWELYEPCTNVQAHVERIKKCPYYNHLEFIAGDWHLFARDQNTASGLKSMAEVFADHGFHMIQGRRDCDYATAIRMKSEWWANPDKPRAFITDACPNLKQEMRGLRLKENSAVVDRDNNRPEKIVQKKNHACDASFYAIDKKPTRFKPQNAVDTSKSIAAFIARAEAQKRGTQRQGRRGGIVVV